MLPAELTPTFADGRTGVGVPFRDQAGQVFYRTFDADGQAVGWLSAPVAVTALPLVAVARAAAPIAQAVLAAETAMGPPPLKMLATLTLGATAWWALNVSSDALFRDALTPDEIREMQRPLEHIPVSPGPAGTPGQVVDNRDTSLRGYEVTNRPYETSTTTPIVEQSWEDLIVNANSPKWVLVNGVPLRSDLAAHLAGPDGFKSGRIFGTHNLENAVSLLPGSNYWLAPTATPGILELHYDYFDPSTGTRAAASPKTVYDPAIISDQTMLDAATRAGNQAWSIYSSTTGTKPVSYVVVESGIRFQVYINTDQGNAYVGNVHPIK
jgi:hypothetical protein